MMNQTSEEIRNPRLIEAMQAMLRHDSEKTRGHMAEELMVSRLLAPVQRQTVLTEREGPTQKGTNIIWHLRIWKSITSGMKTEPMTRRSL